MKKVRFRLPSIKEYQIAALGYKNAPSWELADITVDVGISEKGEGDLSKGKRKQQVNGNEILYPWHGSTNILNKVQNRFNCFLGNFKVPEDCKPCVTPSPGMDGYTMMGRVASYFPNDIGLFDVVGNVAEMSTEKGKACGGSWNHTPEESTIESVNEYAGPHASIGFRIFMEVIEP